ncbi:MAG: hypothetical protein R3314_05660 [Longimicrobiales bacterium]|nr:hypothetical protein [Longimicrobiales bacterium]
MVTQEAETVLLSDAEAAPELAAVLEAAGEDVACYTALGDLLRERSLSSIGVLVLHFGPSPKGTLLATLGRLKHEYPGMQKVAVMEGSVPLPIAKYLTECGVDFFWPKEEGTDRLAGVVDDMHERTRWLVTQGGRSGRRAMGEDT